MKSLTLWWKFVFLELMSLFLSSSGERTYLTFDVQDIPGHEGFLL